MLVLKEKLRTILYERLKDLYPIVREDIDFLYPPQAKFGDLALSLPLSLAKKIGDNPRKIAQKMAAEIGVPPGISRLEIAGAGFINLFLDPDPFFAERLASAGRGALRPEEQKIIVEHTNINPNKAAHIGHLRNACLGDTLVRCLRAKGETVEVQNYLDDTGVQVVDVVYGLMELERKTEADLDRIERFDYYCWDLYARTVAYLEEHPESRGRKAEILKNIEHGRPPESGMAFAVSRRVARAHLRTMTRIGAAYDVLPCESSILGLRFWERAFALLKERRAISLQTEGPNAGCWVMKVEDEDDREKIIVRGDGTVTYVGKDIAYQMWKFGLLGRDFYYEPFAEENGRTLWISTAEPNGRKVSFGGAGRVYNVIDSRQAYLQKVVVQGLRALHFEEQAERSVHFSYEMVALSPRSLKYLGLEAAAGEEGKSFVEVSGRKGLGVKADDLLDLLEEKARAEVDKRNPDLPDEAKNRTAADIAKAALRYFMLKFARHSMIVFDVDEALSFEGETGPYLLYTVVRLNSIFRKLEEREGTSREDIERRAAAPPPSFDVLDAAERTELWDLIAASSKLEEEILHSLASLEFSHLAKFAFLLSQKVNAYYHRRPVLSEERPDVRGLRILGLHHVRGVLERVLDLMGLSVPERM
ncbi:MAG TPA: arginine--tRNA ligase [Candidatus Aminicenantes bacterium]|nr:arginine--tRNA ligase [Candidatus Aminicenantes bacterium]